MLIILSAVLVSMAWIPGYLGEFSRYLKRVVFSLALAKAMFNTPLVKQAEMVNSLYRQLCVSTFLCWRTDQKVENCKNNLISASFRIVSRYLTFFFSLENVTFFLLEISMGRSCFSFFFFLPGIMFPFCFCNKYLFFSSCRLKEERETCLSSEDAVLVFSYLSWMHCDFQ